MNLQQRILAFSKLGRVLEDYLVNNKTLQNSDKELLDNAVVQALQHNAWFTKDNIHYTLKAWSTLLTTYNLESWLTPYSLSINQTKTVGVVMAGNIPMVGMHDFVSVLISGHKILLKQSSSDKFLLPAITKLLVQIQPMYQDFISFAEGKLSGFDAVIATGSNNTARYFEAYFSKYPHIIRKNRNAVAVLTGDESDEELLGLGEDIFRYFGLGCRSVSKLFIPNGYDLNRIFRAIYPYQGIIHHNKYKNNYDYNRAIYIMGGVSILENGFVLFKEDTLYASPIAVVFYEYYKTIESIQNKLDNDSTQIQCVISKSTNLGEVIAIGEGQSPALWNYADGVDTLKFLQDI